MTDSRSSKRPAPISGALNRIIKSAGLSSDYDGWTVVTRWHDIVGPGIAKVASATDYADGCITVAVPDASWRQELTMKQDELLAKIRSYPFGKSIRRIRLTQGKKGID